MQDRFAPAASLGSVSWVWFGLAIYGGEGWRGREGGERERDEEEEEEKKEEEERGRERS
jgi:hypothetical protein